jgi:fluoroquinolone transport system permease protein
MKAHISTFKFGLKQITRDNMLVLMMIAPFLSGIAFKFGLPILDEILANKFGVGKILEPYFRTFDSLLVFLAPSLVCIVSSFLILDEFDDKVSSYIFVTPIGYGGYIFARLVIPSIFAFLLSLGILMVFNLTNIPLILALVLALIATLYAIATTLVVVSIAKNKVEGLAMVKLTGISFLGILVPAFIKGNIQYLFSMLPSFWLAKVSLEYGSKTFITTLLLGLICSMFWIVVFYRTFKRKLA